MMAKNPHFRLLALTATPGGKTEAVQNLIDGLHISRIEIRDENSLDLKDYIHLKVRADQVNFAYTLISRPRTDYRAACYQDVRRCKQG